MSDCGLQLEDIRAQLAFLAKDNSSQAVSPHCHPRSMARPLSTGSCRLIALVVLAALLISPVAQAFTVGISDADQLRQTCSGMLAGKNSRIEVTVDKGAKGTVATMFYEFQDFDKLGKESPESDSMGYHLRTYICTDQAVKEKLCTASDLGNFIVDESEAKANTVQLQRLDFGATGGDARALVSLSLQSTAQIESTDCFTSQTYNVTSKGYYCFGASELLFLHPSVTSVY